MRCTRVGRSWNRNRGEGFVLDSPPAAGRGAGGASPLEVEAAEMAGDIHDFANKEKTGDFAGFHSFARKFIGVHTAGGAMSRRARSANLTRYGMVAAEHLQCFTGRTHTTLLYVLKALPDSLKRIGLCGDVEQALIGFGILHDRFRFPIDCKNKRFLRLLEMLHELPRIAPECRVRLNVYFDIKHTELALQ